MGFIDWLTKDNSVAVDEEVKEEKNEVVEQPVIDDDALNCLKELSNNEKMQTAEYDEEYDNEDDFEVNKLPQTNFQMQQNASFTIFKVIDEEDVRQVLKHLSENAPCIATFENVKKKDLILLMKYLQGGTFVLGANMSEWQKDAYIIVPRGMTINLQEKTKRK